MGFMIFWAVDYLLQNDFVKNVCFAKHALSFFQRVSKCQLTAQCEVEVFLGDSTKIQEN